MMKAIWVNQEETIGNIIDGERYVVVEKGHPRWDEFLSLSPEPVVPPEEPTAEELLRNARAGMTLSFAQLLIGLVERGWITVEEGRAWRDRVALPGPVQVLIAGFPEGQRFAAETRAYAPSVVARLDPLVVGLGRLSGKTPEEMDAFFLEFANK
jgi:hypothetical protein